jgi:hypothetical protein
MRGMGPVPGVDWQTTPPPRTTSKAARALDVGTPPPRMFPPRMFPLAKHWFIGDWPDEKIEVPTPRAKPSRLFEPGVARGLLQ